MRVSENIGGIYDQLRKTKASNLEKSSIEEVLPTFINYNSVSNWI